MIRIVRVKVVLQYGRAGESTSTYSTVSQHEAEKFVALDAASGGYPYATSIDEAHDFKTIEKALEYSRGFAGFHPRTLTITYQYEQTERLGTTDEIVDHDSSYAPVLSLRRHRQDGEALMNTTNFETIVSEMLEYLKAEENEYAQGVMMSLAESVHGEILTRMHRLKLEKIIQQHRALLS